MFLASFRFIASTLGLFLALSLWPHTATAVTPSILAFQASSYQVDRLQPVRLSWQVQNAGRVDVYDGFRDTTYSNLGQNNYIEVWPEKSASYILSAYGEHGEVVQRSLNIAWVPLAIEFYKASTTLINSVQAVRLNWKVSGATRVDIYDGFRKTTYADLGSQNYIEVWPEETATYTLKVYGQGQLIESQITIQFDQQLPKIIDYLASTQVLQSPRIIALSWVVEGARSIEIFDSSSGQSFKGLLDAI